MAARYVPDTRGYREAVVRDDLGKLVAVVTRPCEGAKWFLHRAGRVGPRGEPFPTRKAAVEAAMKNRTSDDV